MKKSVAIVLALVLLLVCAVGGTLAWLTASSGTVTNTFTVGDVDISLDETDTDDSNEDGSTTDRDTENHYDKILPGGTYAKDPIVHIAENSEDCYVFVTVANGLADYEPDADDTAAEGEAETIAEQMIANGWTKLKDEDGAEVWYYGANGTLTVAHANEDLTVFTSFTIDGDKVGTEAEINAVNTAKIIVNAYAIQANHLTGKSIEDIWAAAKTASVSAA